MKTASKYYSRFRRIVTVILTILLATMVSGPIRTMAEPDEANSDSLWYTFMQQEGYDFSTPEQLRAAYYVTSPSVQYWARGSYYAPSEKYVDALEEDAGFTASVIAWKTANLVFNPAELAEALAGTNPITHLLFDEEEFEKVQATDPLGEVGYYEAMLLDALTDEVYSNKLLDAINAKKKQYQVDSTKKCFKSLYDAARNGAQYLNELEDEDAEIVDQSLMDYLSVDMKVMIPSGVYGELKLYIGQVKSIEAKVERVSSLLAMRDVSQSYISVLEKIQDYCSDDANQTSLYHACGELLLACKSSDFSSDYFITSEMFSYTTFDSLLRAYLTKLWKKTGSSLGGAWSVLGSGYTVGKTFSNTFLSTDTIIEKYFDMRCLKNIRLVLSSICLEERSKFYSDPSQENAQGYLDTVDFAMKIYDLELRQAQKYVSILDSTNLNKVLAWFGNVSDHSSLIDRFEAERTDMQFDYELSKSICQEIFNQGSEHYVDVYGDNCVTLANQHQFDMYCEIYGQMRSLDKEKSGEFGIAVTSDVVVDGEEREIGNAKFTGLTLKNGANMTMNGNLECNNISMSGSSRLAVAGKARVYSFTEMHDGDVLHVDDKLTVGHSRVYVNSPYRYGSLEGGVVEAAGDMQLVGDEGYRSDGTHTTALVGSGHQTLLDTRTNAWYDNVGCCYLNLVDLRNFRAEVDLQAEGIALAGDGEATSIRCSGLDLSGFSLNVSGPVTALLNAPENSVLRAQSLDGSVDARHSEITLTGHCDGPTGHFSLVSSELKCGSTDIGTLGLSESSSFISTGDARICSLREMHDGDLLHVDGNLTAGHGTVYVNTPYGTGSMEGGTIEVAGDMTLVGDNGFSVGESTLVIFNGERAQAVSLPESGRAYIVKVALRNPLTSITSKDRYHTLELVEDGWIDSLTGYAIDLKGHELQASGAIAAKVLAGPGSTLSCGSLAGDLEANAATINVTNDISSPTGRMFVSESTIQCGTAEIGTIGLSNASSMIANADARIYSVKEMHDGDLIRVLGKLTIGHGRVYVNSPYQYGILEGGAVEVAGDMELIGNEGFHFGGAGLVAFIGNEKQTIVKNNSTGACYFIHAVVAQSNQSNAEMPTNVYSPITVVHDPTYQTGDKYIEFATVPNLEYTSESISPDVYYGNNKLVQGIDYSVLLDTGDGKTAVGTYNLEISGITPYKGTKVFAYRITQADISKATVTGYEDVVYNGTNHTPELTVVLNNLTLAEGTDYTVQYSDNKKVGTAIIYVHGTGSYTNRARLTFNINPTEEGQRVIDLIAALNTSYLSGEDDIVAARAEYDALSQIDQESVTNYYRLQDGESNMASLHAAVESANQAISDAETLLDATPVSADGSDVDEEAPWITQSQADDLTAKITNTRTYVEAGGTLYYLRNATSSLTSTCSTTKTALESQLGTMHVLGEPVEEGRIEATCTDEGGYDLVTYCTVCGEETSRTHKTIDALGHDYDSVEVPPTWDDAGYTRHTCSRCQDTYNDEPVESLKVQGALAVETTIAGLPAADDLTLADADAVAAARNAFDALTEEQQGLVANASTLALAEARLADLSAAKAVDDLLAALPAPNEVALNDQAEVAAARAAYDALTDAQKALVANLEALENAEQAIDDLVSQLQLVGTCVWEVTDDGELVISPIPGRATGELPDTWDSPAGGGGGSLWTRLMGESRPADVTSVRIEPGVRAGASLSLFLGEAGRGEEYFPNLRSVDLTNLDTSNVTDVSGLFAGNESLESIVGIESLVSATVTEARKVFYGCSVLEAVDISSWDTSGIADTYAIDGLFEGCDSLAEVRLGEGLEMARLDVDLPEATWTNGSLYVGGATIEQLSADQAASTWVRHTPMDISTACEFAAIPAQQHTGSPVTPMPVVTYEGVALECETYGQATGAGFAVTYEDNVAVGEATAIVSGQGRFSGEARVPFRILAQGDFDVEHMVEELESAVTTAAANSTKANAALDAVRAAASGDDVDAAEARVTRAESAESQTAQVEQEARSSYEAATAYASTCPVEERAEAERAVEEAFEYLRAAMRAHSDAQEELTAAQSALEDVQQRLNAVTEAEAAAEVATQALADAQASLEKATDLANATVSEVPTYGYTGSAAEPQPTVTVNGATLRLGTDYTLRYVGNTDAGTATVVVEGTGHFGGSQNVEFAIQPKDLSEVAVATLPDATYTGEANRPELTITNGETVLVKDTDYEVSYEANTDAGDAVAHASGKGNYTGTANVPFRILKAAISPEVSLASWSWADNPNVPVVAGNLEGMAVIYEYKLRSADDEDYALAVPTEPGQYTVRATVAEGTNHLGNICTCDFAITWMGVTFDPNGGEGTMAPQSFEHEATQALTDNAFAREGMRFTGWNTKADGTGQAYEDGATVTLSESVTLYAQWADAHHTVTFMSNGVVVARLTTDFVTSNDFPSDPTPLYGFEFNGWDKTAAEANAGLATGDVTVTAQFKAKQNDITVTIYNGESEDPETMTLSESQWVKVTAEDVPGKNFAYWTMGGMVLSYNRVAQFRTATSCTVTAVYTTEAVSAEGTAVMRTITYDATTRKLASVAYLTVPDGSTIIKAGLVAASATSTTFDPNRELSLDNADYKKESAKAVGKCAPVSYTWTKSSVSPGDTWYVRPYVRYELGGEVVTVYGDRMDVTAGEDYDQSERATAIIRSSGYDASTKKAQFVAYIALPDGGVITKAGLVASPATSFDPAVDVLTCDNADFVKESSKAVGKQGPLTYTWNKSNVEPGDTWYARAYVIYTIGGQERTLYGTLTSLIAAA